MEQLLYVIPAAGVLALLYAYVKAAWVKKQDAGDGEMQDIARLIQEGAIAFLRAEYRVLAIFVVIVAVLLAVGNSSGAEQSPLIAVSFVIGAIASGLAGYFGMRVATNANVRTTAAARKSLPEALGEALGAARFAAGLILEVMLTVTKPRFGGFSKHLPPISFREGRTTFIKSGVGAWKILQIGVW